MIVYRGDSLVDNMVSIYGGTHQLINAVSNNIVSLRKLCAMMRLSLEIRITKHLSCAKRIKGCGIFNNTEGDRLMEDQIEVSMRLKS